MQQIKREKIDSMIQAASDLELELVWIKRIMEGQTHDEECAETTKYHNDIGLNGSDAHFVTSVYHQIGRGKHLTQKQSDRVRRTLPKYWKQYASMMNNAAPSTVKAAKHIEKQVMEDSCIEPCQECSCKSFIYTRQIMHDEEEISHWDAVCQNCGAEVTILND